MGLPYQVLLIFLDDVIVHTKSFEEVVRCLRLVFERLQSANLKLSPKKCFLPEEGYLSGPRCEWRWSEY